MPVFWRLKGDVLVVTADGDYTPEELRRVGTAGLHDPGTPKPARVLLDMSGAAGLGGRAGDTLRDTALHFAEQAPALGRVAILAPGDVEFGLMRMAEVVFNQEGGAIAGVFRSRADALRWLEERPEGAP